MSLRPRFPIARNPATSLSIAAAAPAGELDAKKVGTIDIAEPERRPCIRGQGGEFDTAEFDIARVPDVEVLRRQRTEAGRLRIFSRPLDRLQRGRLCGPAAFVDEEALGDLDVLDRVDQGSHSGSKACRSMAHSR